MARNPADGVKLSTVAFGLTALLVFGLAACGSSSPAAPAPEDTVAVPTLPPVPTATLAATESPAPATEPTSTPVSATTTISPPTEPPAVVGTPTAQALLAERLADEAWEHLVKLTEEMSPRTSATEREKAAADYLLQRFEAMGYDARLQTFDIELLASDPPVFSVDGSPDLDMRGIPLQKSARGRVSGVLVGVGKAFEGEIQGKALEGNIALIERGSITFAEKVARVAGAGARAAVIYNNQRGLFGGSLANDADIPAVGISQADGESLLKQMSEGDLQATVSVVLETHETRNVIAEKPGSADDGGVVVLGGHYDTVPDVAGANDNGSGIATLLTIAREVANKDYPFTLRFIPFGAEEVGLRGSRYYVQSLSDAELEAIAVMLNFDALATGDVTGVLGNFELMGKIVDFGTEHGIKVERRFTPGAGTSSDHASFTEAEVPVIFFLADDYSRIHTKDDVLEFAQRELMGNSAALAIGLLDILAESR